MEVCTTLKYFSSIKGVVDYESPVFIFLYARVAVACLARFLV